MGMMKALFTEWQIDAERQMGRFAAPCTCLPREPDDQCTVHGYEEWKALRASTGAGDEG